LPLRKNPEAGSIRRGNEKLQLNNVPSLSAHLQTESLYLR